MSQKNVHPDPDYPRPAPPPSPPARSRFYLSWIYDRPPDHEEYLLLDNERRAHSGVWYGAYGKPFIAYSPMPRTDKRVEKDLIAKGIIKG